ncbi:saxitoxin and tetrodotoxin-binding protein 1-like [Cololabis saira]|uniref:saxitoxin and tetrodotoxin-binding protein 1-like n=1 Tax=Cololabis saira TaxID=129043 RepID=UPI002AD31348|nr:saxitoxin and tetrodotoxin-binding protein 1-like [Cololabis saira]
MNIVKVAGLLVLVAIGSNAEPNSTECDGLTHRLQTKDLHKAEKDNVVVESESDTAAQPDNEPIFRVHGCVMYYINATQLSVNDTEHLSLHGYALGYGASGMDEQDYYNLTADIDFYEPCPDCLLIIYKLSDCQYFLSYRKEGSHRDVDQHKAAHDDHKKLSECMGIFQDKPYIYDGVRDFCHKKSVPDANA